MENKMTYLKVAILSVLQMLILACGSTRNEEIDYTQITDAEMMQMADQKMQAGDYQNAITDYKKLLLDFPTSNLHIDAQIRIAEAYGKLDKFEDQMNQLYRLVKENISDRGNQGYTKARLLGILRSHYSRANRRFWIKQKHPKLWWFYYHNGVLKRYLSRYFKTRSFKSELLLCNIAKQVIEEENIK